MLQNPRFKILFSHALSLIYLAIASYILYWKEYDFGRFFSFYHERVALHFPVNTHSLIIIPVTFWVLCGALGLAFFALEPGQNKKKLFAQTILGGLFVQFFILLLTLQQDSFSGNFYWPEQLKEFPYKAEYVRAVISILFVGIYFFIIRLWTVELREQNGWLFPVLYLPVLPYVFNISVFWHIVAFSTSFGIFILNQKSEIPWAKFKIKILSAPPYIWAIVILLVGIIFRFWHLHYIGRIQDPEYIQGLGSDANEYYRMARHYLDGKFTYVQQTPSYAYLLSLFMSGGVYKAMLIQGAFLSLVPLLVFYIAKNVFNIQTAFLACICVALSSNLIIFSVIIQRAGPACFFMTAMTACLVALCKKQSRLVYLLFGFSFGWIMLLDGVMAPMIILVIIPLYQAYQKFGPAMVGTFFVFTFLGFLAAELPFNLFVLKNTGDIWLFGRPFSSSVDAMVEGSTYLTEEITALVNAGFDPAHQPIQSLVNVLKNPLEMGELIWAQFFREAKNYFFDHQLIYLDPFLLNRETYFSSSIGFYFFPLLFFGIVAFVVGKKIDNRFRLILGVPALFSFCFFTIIHLGFARYGLVVWPLFLMFFAYGLSLTFSFLFRYEYSGIINPAPKIFSGTDQLAGVYFFRTGLAFLVIWTFMLAIQKVGPRVTDKSNWVRYKTQNIFHYKGLYRKGRKHFEKGDFDKALEYFLLAENEPRAKTILPEIENNIAQVYYKKNQFDLAEIHWKKAIKNKPIFWQYYRSLGNLYFDTGRFKEAVDQYKQSLSLNPNEYKVCFVTALAYLRLGDASQAILMLKETLRLRPNFEKARQALIELDEFMKNQKQALR
jgi:tetratricopeptide (TPR) repeat protein